MSPDGVMQMAIQLAYTRLHKQTVSVYESASTSSFLRGRTETIRSCTPASTAFVATMMQQTASAEDKNRALRNACAVYKPFLHCVFVTFCLRPSRTAFL